MTSVPSNVELAVAVAPAATIAARVWHAIEARLIALTERANPILVKETRQALKSRQFVVTFLIVLAACWIASIAGVEMIGPQIYYAAAGPEMLIAYYAILAFPLAVIVPYSAFRSLAAEQEDNTYDLLSITTLTPRQVISGKLWSSIVQMVVYLSAVSPCIAFTFLLRGVDVLTTAMLLLIAVVGSLGLSMLSLFVGASARMKHTQVVTSVALVLALFGAFICAIMLAGNAIYEGFPRQPEFWGAMLVLATLYVTTFGLLHAASAAQVSFASENRSTPLRRWMMAQQACFVGGIAGYAYAFIPSMDVTPSIVFVGTMLAAAYWYVLGALMTSEWPHLSRRVQRSLPQSTLGRTVLSFFNPGPGAGYMFAVSNFTALVICGLVCAWATSASTTSVRSFSTVGCALVLMWGYVIGYLGLGRLFISFLRRWIYVSLTAGFLCHVVLVMAGVGIPMTIQMMSRTLQNEGYTMLQMSNPFWTIQELTRRGPAGIEASITVWLVVAFGLTMLVINMPGVARELQRHRIEAPTRVIEEEALLHPAPTPAPSSPWELASEEDGPP